jgi:uncharacterized membrane protein (DUF485 family)
MHSFYANHAKNRSLKFVSSDTFNIVVRTTRQEANKNSKALFQFICLYYPSVPHINFILYIQQHSFYTAWTKNWLATGLTCVSQFIMCAYTAAMCMGAVQLVKCWILSTIVSLPLYYNMVQEIKNFCYQTKNCVCQIFFGGQILFLT